MGDLAPEDKSFLKMGEGSIHHTVPRRTAPTAARGCSSQISASRIYRGARRAMKVRRLEDNAVLCSASTTLALPARPS